MALVNEQPVSYLQTDPRWANISYSAGGESTTIGKSGCGPTSMAMVLATWADKNVTPKTECAWALANGYKAPYQGTYYSYFVPAAARYGLTCTRVNTASIYGNANSVHHNTAKEALDNGDLVIACMGKGTWCSSGHYVTLYGIEGNMVYINDPASTKVARTHGNYLVFKQQVKYYWIIKRPSSHPLTTEITYEDVDYAVRITDKAGLNCRKGPGVDYMVVKVYPYESEVRISQVSSNGWAKTEHGWVNLTNTERVEDLTKQETESLISEAISKIQPTVYNSESEIPEWYKDAYEKIKPVLQGKESGFALTEDILRVVTYLDRLGKL